MDKLRDVGLGAVPVHFCVVDSCATNIGERGGVVVLLERALQQLQSERAHAAAAAAAVAAGESTSPMQSCEGVYLFRSHIGTWATYCAGAYPPQIRSRVLRWACSWQPLMQV